LHATSHGSTSLRRGREGIGLAYIGTKGGTKGWLLLLLRGWGCIGLQRRRSAHRPLLLLREGRRGSK